ncbi:MAG: TMEM165/GDT1 family protein [Caulobacterales bacterium]
MQAYLISAGLVALAEIGDRTQILSILLAARYRKPLPIIAGILVATVANHLMAAALGSFAGGLLHGPWVKWILGAAFIGFAFWTLVPDKLEEDDRPRSHGSVFVTTVVTFFMAEMGDKTQIVTIALGARFHEILWVAAGTTTGMLIANVPAVYIGEMAATRLPVKPLRFVAAAALFAQGIWVLVSKG